MKIVMMLLVGMGCTSVLAESYGVSPQAMEAQKKTESSAEDRLYQQQMLKLSKEISQKITEIQAKERELQNEIYPAYKAEHRYAIERLESQLKSLEQQKSRLESEKTAQEMAKSLERKP